ncbi:MAG: C40 family peptidase [Sphingomonadaceae bacterium]|nr:C40 family peptidase [Sphingomonadaceae bacterium]
MTAGGSASPTRAAEQVRLSGPSVRLDTRINAIRPDLVDLRLADRVLSAHYAAPIERVCTTVAAVMRGRPSADAPAVSELLMGERFQLLEISGDWAWGYSAHDDYVGYLPRKALGAPTKTPTHIVSAAAALVFSAPDIKSPVVARWPMGGRFVAEEEGEFLTCRSGYIHCRHAQAIGGEIDPVVAAERLIGTPYRWGGRSGDGIDCSGLVQLALAFAGVVSPRDSDQQRALGEEIAAGDALVRGDIICFPGHIGFMADEERLVHANAHWMAVTVEPLADIVARLTPRHAEPIVARRRLP